MKFWQWLCFFFSKDKDLHWYKEYEKRNTKLLNLVGFLSICVLAVYVVLPFVIGTEIEGVKIQDIGSYLSGITSTGVLLWLILGHMSQSITNARQAREVQENLELTRKSLELTRAMHQEERLKVFNANQPNFTQALAHKFEHVGQTYIAFSFTNIGFPVTDIYIKNSQGYCCSEKVTMLDRGESAMVKTEFTYFLNAEEQNKVPMFKKCWIHYRDYLGVSRHAYVHLYWFPFPVNGIRIPAISIKMPESPEQSVPSFDEVSADGN